MAAAVRAQLLQRREQFGRGGGRRRLEAFAHDRQHACVDSIGLGELARGLCEQPRAQGIDDGNPITCGVQNAVGQAVELGRRFHDDQLDIQSDELALEGFEALRRVPDAQCLASRMEIDVEPFHANVDADIDISDE